MKIRKFTGKNFQTAFQKMKSEMGDNAIILNSRKLPATAGAPAAYEITAVLDEKVLSLPEGGVAPGNAAEKYKKNEEMLTGQPETRKKYEPSQKVRKPKNGKEFLSQLQQYTQMETIKEELTVLKNSLDGMMELIKDSRLPVLPDKLKRLYQKLINMDVQENLARTITQTILAKLSDKEIENNEILSEFLKKLFSSIVKIGVPLEKMRSKRQQIVALVGPTGVGKTTTIAKIAANNKIFHGKKVGIITADTFRIAAVEQIQTFANIAGIPIEVVYDPQEMKDAIRSLKDMDLILIDTVGRSQRKSEHLQKIKEFIDAASPQQVHLVLSLTGSTKNLLEVAHNFSVLKPNRFIFTKLDEVSGAGNILNIAYKTKIPVSYVTTGQNVPDDVLLPDHNSISRLLLYGLD